MIPAVVSCVIGELQPDVQGLRYDPEWLTAALSAYIGTFGGARWGTDRYAAYAQRGRAFGLRQGPPGCAVVTVEIELSGPQAMAVERGLIRCGLEIVRVHVRSDDELTVARCGVVDGGSIVGLFLSPDGIDGPVYLGER